MVWLSASRFIDIGHNPLFAPCSARNYAGAWPPLQRPAHFFTVSIWVSLGLNRDLPLKKEQFCLLNSNTAANGQALSQQLVLAHPTQPIIDGNEYNRYVEPIGKAFY